MKTIIEILLLTSFAVSTAAHSVEIRHASEVRFQTERGRYYQLQRSTNMVTWQDFDEPVYGDGAVHRRLKPTEGGGSGHGEFFRVLELGSTTNGFAPPSLAGWTINFDDAPGGDLMSFTTTTNGVDHGEQPDPISYTLSLLGPDQIRINVTGGGYSNEKFRDIYVMTFESLSSGTWVRDEYRKGMLKDRDAGVFGVVKTNGPAGGMTPNPGTVVTNPVPPMPTNPPPANFVIPSRLGGKVVTFVSGTPPERLTFNTDTSGIETGDSDPTAFTAIYRVQNTETATLVVKFKQDKWDEYQLRFDSPDSGSAVRHEFDQGVLKDADTMPFTIRVAVP